MGRCPHCRSRNIRRRHREHRIYRWRCCGCNTIFRRPRRGIPTWAWIVAAVGVVVILTLALWWALAPPPTSLVSEHVPTGVTRIDLTLTMQSTPSAIRGDDGLLAGWSRIRLAACLRISRRSCHVRENRSRRLPAPVPATQTGGDLPIAPWRRSGRSRRYDEQIG